MKGMIAVTCVGAAFASSLASGLGWLLGRALAGWVFDGGVCPLLYFGDPCFVRSWARATRPPVRPGHPLRSLRSASPYAARRGRSSVALGNGQV